MRRVVLAVATWSAGTLLAMALVSWAVGRVSSEVVSRPPAPISNGEVAAALAADGAAAGTTTVPTAPGAPAGGGAAPPPSAPGASPTTGPPGAVTATTVPRTPPRPGPAPASTTSTPTSTPATTVAPAPAPDATTTTVDSVGGQVAVRYEGGRVHLVWARPKAGFEAEVDSSGPETVDVRFESEDHESRIRAFYSDGVPDREVREQADGGDGEN